MKEIKTDNRKYPKEVISSVVVDTPINEVRQKMNDHYYFRRQSQDTYIYTVQYRHVANDVPTKKCLLILKDLENNGTKIDYALKRASTKPLIIISIFYVILMLFLTPLLASDEPVFVFILVSAAIYICLFTLYHINNCKAENQVKTFERRFINKHFTIKNNIEENGV